ncbi:CBM35 domain-containing protein [Streptomyces sp. NBC_01465]|uniref:CBM35 domain-containing protein n=1 Tax=Streptomyces sp. NBC_01465 TaxID=2903878 RepID=UPI002E3662B7|nr:CBM35 domain-containing protein [Streptomyces sp. NBC_01465]
MSTPEDDDPFGYLYEDGRAAGAVPPPGGGGYGYPGPSAGGQQQPGVPRTSYNQVRTVGERQYGQPQQPQQPQQQGYGQQPQQQYTQPTAQYAAPETYGNGAPPQQPRYQDDYDDGGRGPNHKGILIGAVAVVAVVVIGITVALMNGGDDTKDNKAGAGSTSSAGAGQSVKPSDPASESPEAKLPKQDAATLQLGGGAITDKTVTGAQGPGGTYINGFNAVGSSVTWQANVEQAGEYKLSVRYAIPAVDANATLTVNDKANNSPLGLKNFIKSSDTDWAKNWQTTWAPVNLKQGENTIKISCEQGNQCNAILDWLAITKK